MRKQILKAVIAQLKLIQQNENGYFVADAIDTDKAVIKHFDLWNQQLEYLIEEQPFDTPAVFIEFLPISWRHQAQGTRDANITISLHVVTARKWPTRPDQAYTDDALRFFELLDTINLCLHGFKGENFGSFTALQSTTDTNFDELMHSTEQYSTMATDVSAAKTQHKVQAAVVIEM